MSGIDEVSESQVSHCIMSGHSVNNRLVLGCLRQAPTKLHHAMPLAEMALVSDSPVVPALASRANAPLSARIRQKYPRDSTSSGSPALPLVLPPCQLVKVNLQGT